MRNERVFDVAHVTPRSADWKDFQRLHNVLVIGEPADPWVAEALQAYSGSVPTPPAIVQVHDVWARTQLVTVLLMPPGSGPEAVRPLIPRLGQQYIHEMETYARARMFATGADSALADSLLKTAGFGLLVPHVYRLSEPQSGLFVFRNDNPDPSKLIRQLEVASRPAGEVELSGAAVRDWRARVAEVTTQPPQAVDTVAKARELQVDGHPALEIQGAWSNPPGEWPAGGPFITRLVQCPERAYLVDAWLYAPGKSKFQYMVQLQTMLDSFRCSR